MLKNSIRGFVLGAPGAGKGTIVAKLNKHFNNGLNPISSGDLLRAKINNDPKSDIAQLIGSGKLVSDKLMIGMIFQELANKDLLSRSWLLDGFPRTGEQAKLLDAKLNEMSKPLNVIIELDVPHQVIYDRIAKRWIHKPSGRVYNLDYNPPKVAGKDDITGEPLTKRPDDVEQVVKQRLDLYDKMLIPIRDHYANSGIWAKFTGDSSDVLYPQIAAFLSQRFN